MFSALATIAIAAPLVLAGERSFFHFPSVEDVRVQPISRSPNETGWPFSVEAGNLLCVWSTGRRLAMFFEERPGHLGDDEEFAPRGVILTVNPFELTLLNVAARDLFQPAASVEELIERVAPFALLGEKLCDQPAGAQVGHGEL